MESRKSQQLAHCCRLPIWAWIDLWAVNVRPDTLQCLSDNVTPLGGPKHVRYTNLPFFNSLGLIYILNFSSYVSMTRSKLYFMGWFLPAALRVHPKWLSVHFKMQWQIVFFSINFCFIVPGVNSIDIKNLGPVFGPFFGPFFRPILPVSICLPRPANLPIFN